MKKTVAEVVPKLNALSLWGALASSNFALKPRGTVFPYFCTAIQNEAPGLKIRVMLIEGWQTFHDYLRGRADPNFGVASAPIELPHFELLVLESGDYKVFRYDTGYVPRGITEREEPLLARLLWEVYGFMMRLESDSQLPMRYAGDQAIFARVEKTDGEWEDAPLAIVQPQVYTEKIQFNREAVKKAADLPLMPNEAVAVNFRLLVQIATKEPRPRCIYELSIVDCETKKDLFREQTSIVPAVGLKGMWESMPSQVLHDFLQLGRVPGQIRCVSARVFRFLRPLCIELPIKLSLHDKLD